MASLSCLSSIKRQRKHVDYAAPTARKSRAKQRRLIAKSLADIPIELLEVIIHDVPSFGSLVALSQTCRTFRYLMKQDDFWRESCLLAGFGKAKVYDRAGIDWRVLAMSIHWHGMECFHCSDYYCSAEFIIERGTNLEITDDSTDRRTPVLSELIRNASSVAVNWFTYPPEPVIGAYLEEFGGFEDPFYELHRHITRASALATATPVNSLQGSVHSELPFGWDSASPPKWLIDHIDQDMKGQRAFWRGHGVTWFDDADRRELAHESAFHYAEHDDSFYTENSQGAVTCVDVLQAICHLDCPPMGKDGLYRLYGGLKVGHNGRIEMYYD